MLQAVQKILMTSFKIILASLKNLKRHLTGEEKILIPSFKILIVSFGILVSSFLIINNNTYADESSNLNYSVTVEPALNITTSSNKVSLDLNPLNHDFDSQDLTVSVSTNNETGYKLYVNANSNKLIEKDDNSLYIETLDKETTSENDFTLNRWGYKLNTESYLPFVSGTLINSSKTATENNSSTLTFAAKVGYETKAGAYNLALNFQATANPLVKTIVDAEYLQEVSSKDVGGCPSDLSSTTTYTLKDSRDGQEYKVARLMDGNCWMITNLNLGAIDLAKDLTSENTNLSASISAATFNNWKKTVTTDTYTAGVFMTLSGVDNTNGMPYGTLYNYYAASAATISGNYSTYDAVYDICPAGWRLPTGGASGEFVALYNNNAYNSNTKIRKSVANGGAAFVLAGIFKGGSYVGENGTGYYWASTYYANNPQYVGDNMTALYLHIGGDIPNGAEWRYTGLSVRCILK